jgi:hypothetical protein
MFNERVLPTLDENIKSGNSLIDTDYYDTQLDFGEERKIKPFNWQKGFPEVFNRPTESPRREDLTIIATKAKQHAQKAMEYATQLEEKLQTLAEPTSIYGNKYTGGFDCVIGNPPYVTIGGKEDTLFQKHEVEYLLMKFISNKYKPNLYAFFYENAMRILRADGIVSFIVPRTFIDNTYYQTLREYFVNQSRIISLLKLNYEVFEDATTGGTVICVFQKSNQHNFGVFTSQIDNSEEFKQHNAIQINQKNILINDNKSFSFIDQTTMEIVTKINNKNAKLSYFCSVNNGANTGNVANILLSKEPLNENYRKILEGKDINRYTKKWKNLWINYDATLRSKIIITDLITKQKKIDFALRNERIFNLPKIIVRQTSDKIIATLDKEKFVTRHSTHCILNDFEPIDLTFLLGILNSNVIDYIYNKLVPEKGKAFAEVKAINLKQLPIPLLDLNNPIEKSAHDQIVKLVDQLLLLNHEMSTIKLQSAVLQIESKIEYCEDKINELVYQLYELTAEEIKIVEG